MSVPKVMRRSLYTFGAECDGWQCLDCNPWKQLMTELEQILKEAESALSASSHEDDNTHHAAMTKFMAVMKRIACISTQVSYLHRRLHRQRCRDISPKRGNSFANTLVRFVTIKTDLAVLY
jgi:hypothetical protein